ncbi:MAG: hypothetical protein HRU38_02855 [Saccharospirillaceae bacterium]|nr:hypothetical protein [Colwellia sp.]NRB77602.1 hypothetical protein [Saccharospirillaceae bacterium]
MIHKLLFFILLFTSFISININAEENETLNQIIHQFKIDANELNALLATEVKLEKQMSTLQLQITTAESMLAQLTIKQRKLKDKLSNNPSELDIEFLNLDEEVVNTDFTNTQIELAEYKNDHKSIGEKLAHLVTNYRQLENHQINKRKNIKLLITDKNMSVESVNRSITYPCEIVRLKEQCKSEAKNILLREISEQFAGVELQSITEIDKYLLVKDEVNTQSKVIFKSVNITEQKMIVVAGKSHLKLTISAELQKEITAKEITLLHLKIDTAMDKYLQDNTQFHKNNSRY